MKPITSLKDQHLMTLVRIGKLTGAYPFLRHPRVMIEVREEAIRRDLMPICPDKQRVVNMALDQMQVPPTPR